MLCNEATARRPQGNSGFLETGLEVRDTGRPLTWRIDELRKFGGKDTIWQRKSSNVENLPPQVLRQVSRELCELVRQPPEGIRVTVNEEDVTDIEATIEGPQGTPYAGGVFKLRLVLPKDFPASPPRGFFTTRLFHPNVAVPSGEICVNTLKKDWRPDLGLRQILLTIKCLLIAPNPESALNEEAGRMLLERYDDYCRRARMMTEIHARPAKHKGSSPQGKALKLAKEKRRNLKRL
ncbi:hypothetical protein HPB48_000578 [Haemaphysalis longicornis]|uniref:Ubiquitin-conjugating enzyme E2 S n=1 Tax=Haemaphysalis longicornis TaxID=44386 RepID=A0A9J6FPU3_HAELO|nr:hypothetical protein HPB48_000578 [Haemaphysalis longicornis]